MPLPFAAATTAAFIAVGVGIGIGIKTFKNKSDSDIDPDPDTEIDDKSFRSHAFAGIHESQEIQACNWPDHDKITLFCGDETELLRYRIQSDFHS